LQKNPKVSNSDLEAGFEGGKLIKEKYDEYSAVSDGSGST
jgi:hypothetical protein